MAFNPTMRYQLNIYPPLAIFAGWTVVEILKLSIKERSKIKKILLSFTKGLALLSVIGTIIWGVAFTMIYTEEEPRHAASLWIYENVPGPITLPIQVSENEIVNQQLGISYGHVFEDNQPYNFSFVARADGLINEINFYKFETVFHSFGEDQSKPYHVISIKIGDNEPSFLTPEIEDGKTGYSLALEKPIILESGNIYPVEIIVHSTDALTITGAAPINETAWDLSLPMRANGYDPFGGLYRSDLNLDIYADGSVEKKDRFISMLNDGDYIFISSITPMGKPTSHP